MPPSNQAKSRAAVIKAISSQRFAPYLEACSGHEKNALDLYWWNVRMSSEIYSALHIFEVFLRNSIDSQLREWNAKTPDRDAITGRRSADWILDPNDLIQRKVGDKLEVACRHAVSAVEKSTGRIREPTQDEALAQTSFGLWSLLLPTGSDAGKKKLWDEAIKHAFPNISNGDEERLVIRYIRDTHKLRNRVAHLEPIFRTNVRESLSKMERVLRFIDPKYASWFSGKSIGVDCWNKKPSL